jgi:DNA-binding HxlR family transcriptional regulator
LTNHTKNVECPTYYTLSVIGGRWKSAILFHLGREGVIRYGQLKKLLPPIAHRTLSQQLKELQLHGVISRKQYNEMPPKVEYSLTKKAEKLLPIFNLMNQWGAENWNKNDMQ